MRSVIYKIKDFRVVRVVDEVSINDLPTDEDFMPLEMWNEATDKERFPTQE